MDIKNLKEVVVAGCKGFEAYEQAKKDGKIDASDILFLIPFAQAVGPAIQDISLVPAEALDLDKAELADLLATVLAEVPELKDAAAALVRIEAVMNLLVAAKDCYLAFSGQAPALKLSGLDANLAGAAFKAKMILADRAAKDAPVAAAAAPAAAEADPEKKDPAEKADAEKA